MQSSKVVYAAFESGWPSWNITDQKTLLVFMINVTKPLKVSAYSLFYLSNETFVNVRCLSCNYKQQLKCLFCRFLEALGLILRYFLNLMSTQKKNKNLKHYVNGIVTAVT